MPTASTARCRALLLSVVAVLVWCAPGTLVVAESGARGTASGLPPPPGSRAERERLGRTSRIEAAPAEEAFDEAVEYTRPAPSAVNRPTMRFTVIQPEGKPTTAVPDDPPPDDAELSEAERQYKRWAYAVLSSLRFHRGDVLLPNGVAKLDLGNGYEYLGPEDGARVITEVWGNPPGEPILGVILPAGRTPFEADSWGAVLRYHPIGRVPDGDRSRIDFASLITPMRAQWNAHSSARESAGYAPAKLLGWASLPKYDFTSHVLQWATIAQFDGEPNRTITFEARVLGRHGVLAASIVADANHFPDIAQRVPGLVAMVGWLPGYGYDEFDVDTDPRAPVGLADLVSGRTQAPPDSDDSWWWLLLLLPVVLFAFVLHRVTTRGWRSLLPAASPRERRT